MKTIYSLFIFCALAIAAGVLSLANTSPEPYSASALSVPGDTITFYAVSTSSETRNGQTIYKVNGLPVTKQEYDKYKQSYDDLSNCKPCYVRTYSIDGKLLREGDQYTDCKVGYWKEYYPDGRIKVEGHYRTDKTGKWKQKKSDNWCGIREGKWTYYSNDGGVDSTINFINNIRVK